MGMGSLFLAASLTLGTLTLTIRSLIQPLLATRIAETHDEYSRYVVQRESARTIRYLLFTTVYFFLLSCLSGISASAEVVETSKISLIFVPIQIRAAAILLVHLLDYAIPVLFTSGLVLEVYFVAWYGKKLPEALRIK